jgi:hypothetical protein
MGEVNNKVRRKATKGLTTAQLNGQTFLLGNTMTVAA